MDIAYFISDLLGQQGDVSVPNLGNFVQVRVPAYYDNRSKQFFPPHYSVQFDSQVKEEDESLADYISSVKKISQSSAKYFIEKYITNLKSQAVTGNVELENIGSIKSDGVHLTFNAAKKNDDPSFFAYPAVDVYRIGDTQKRQSAIVNERLAYPVTFTAAPATLPVTEISPVITAPIVQEPSVIEAPEVVYTNEPRGISTLAIVISAVIILIMALGVLYKLRPDMFQQFLPSQGPVVSNHGTLAVTQKDTNSNTTTVPVQHDSIIKTDTSTLVITKNAVLPKSPADENDESKAPIKAEKHTVTPVSEPTAATITAAAPIDIAAEAVAKGSWVIYSQAFPTKRGADGRIKFLKGKGFEQARLATSVVGPGGNYKVILGAFKTLAEANDAKKELLATGKITKDDLSVEKY